MIRHFTSISNVKNGRIINPRKIRHAEVTALRISNLSGFIDPRTHLNLDFPDHLIKEVNVAEELELAGKVMLDGERFAVACVSPTAYKHLGFVDEAVRAEQLKEAVHKKLQSDSRV